MVSLGRAVFRGETARLVWFLAGASSCQPRTPAFTLQTSDFTCSRVTFGREIPLYRVKDKL